MRLPRPVVIPSDTSSTTASKSARSSSAYGAARRTSSKSPSSVHSSAAATSATICWARMSSGATGGQVASRRPARTAGQQRRALDQLVARHGEQDPLGCARPRVVGAPHALQEGGDGAAAIRPGTRAPPARCRCRARATPWPPGRAARRPAGGPRPAGAGPWTGCRGGRPPASGPRRSPRRWARRSDSRRVLTNTSVVRWSCT